ncbi:MAG: hypothetical protein ACXWEY_00715 [Bacteroidia bacterium]
MIDKNATPNPFRQSVSYNSIKPAGLSETRVSIQNEFGNEVRVINMNSRADGIVEIELHEGGEMPFRYHRN